MTPQWKRFYFARRNAALTEVEFPIRWRLHAELGGTFPDGLRRHPQIHYGLVQAIHGGSDRHRYDGIGILWLGSPEWADRASDDPTHRPTMRQDELRVFDRPVYDCALLAQEQVSKSGSLGHAALLRFFRRADLVSDEIFGDASASVGHALAALPEFVSTVGRCTWGTAVRAPTVDFDAFMEFRFDSVKQAAAALSSAAFTVAARTPMDFAASAGTMDQDVLYLVEICHERLAPAASN